MNVMAAWSQGYTGKGVVVTILDDGIERTHPDLELNYVSIFCKHLAAPCSLQIFNCLYLVGLVTLRCTEQTICRQAGAALLTITIVIIFIDAHKYYSMKFNTSLWGILYISGHFTNMQQFIILMFLQCCYSMDLTHSQTFSIGRSCCIITSYAFNDIY